MLNIIVCARGGEFDVVKVVDFGLVKGVDHVENGLTSMNVIPGTPPYIAPERMKGGAVVDGRVDIYALGAVAFNLLTGEPTFDGDTAVEIAYKVMHEPPCRPSERASQAIPAELDKLILATLASDPNERPADIDALLAHLDSMTFDPPWDRARAALWWAEHAPPARQVEAPVEQSLAARPQT